MASEGQLEILKQGREVWNHWREEYPLILPNLIEANLDGLDLRETDLTETRLCGVDLVGADLTKTYLGSADLSGANLSGANLREATLGYAKLIKANLHETAISSANLRGADLTEADLSGAYMFRTNLIGANLSGANLSRANLSWANLNSAILIGADLRGANLFRVHFTEANLSGAYLNQARLEGASLIKTILDGADLSGCYIYGISAWDLNLAKTIQQDLVITPQDQPAITVDDIEVAQFIYLMLNNQKIRKIIDVIGQKGVLILGRFGEERKAVLDAIREELRRRDYLPMMFDFEKPGGRNLTETVTTLARMSRFVIADITDAKSIPQELQAIVPDMPSLPVQPLIQESQYEYAMFQDFLDYHWVLLPYRYQDREQLIASLAENVIDPAESKAEEIAQRRQKMEALMAKPE